MISEPEDKAIVAWFDHWGFPVLVYARDDKSAGAAGEQVGRRWFAAGPANNEGALSWEELDARATDPGLKGPVRLYRTDQQQNEPGA